MSESITARVGRIISGGMNALIDAVEGTAPEMVMEQAIREIDGAIDEVRAELGRVVAAKHLANQRLMDENARHEELSGKIEFAVRESRDDLAEAAIARQLDIEAQMPVLEATISEHGAKEKELEGFINALQGKKREMRQELKQFRDAQQEAAVVAAGHGGQTDTGGQTAGKINKAEAAFDRAQERAGMVSGTRMPDAADAAKLAELDELARRNRIQERLAAIKKQSND